MGPFLILFVIYSVSAGLYWWYIIIRPLWSGLERNKPSLLLGIAQFSAVLAILTLFFLSNYFWFWGFFPPSFLVALWLGITKYPTLTLVPILASSSVAALVYLFVVKKRQTYAMIAATFAACAFFVVLFISTEIRAYQVISREAEKNGIECVEFGKVLFHLGSRDISGGRKKAHAFGILSGKTYAWSWGEMRFYVYSDQNLRREGPCSVARQSL